MAFLNYNNISIVFYNIKSFAHLTFTESLPLKLNHIATITLTEALLT